MISYFTCLAKYAVFRGRAGRKEFWGFFIVNIIILCVILLLHAKYPLGTIHTVLTGIIVGYIVLTICPLLAVMSRRWHDLGRTGAWVWLNLVPVVGTFVSLCFFLGAGNYGTNEYGRDPIRRKKS